MQDKLPQNEPSRLAALFGDRAQTILNVAGVLTARGESKVVSQASWSGKAFDRTNAADRLRGTTSLGSPQAFGEPFGYAVLIKRIQESLFS